MNLSQIPSLLFSPRTGWQALMADRPSTTRTFANVALPFTLLPPAMILLAANTIGAAHFPAIEAGLWELVAAVFLVAELLAVFLMAWAVDASVRAKGGHSDMDGAFLVAAIAPLPLWISSLGLLSSSIALAAGVALLGFIASAVMIRHGIRSVLVAQHVVCPRQVSLRVIGYGALTWVALAGIVLFPIVLLA
ncbi:MAG: hypothetical protein LPJ91_05345 [Pseudazoarcus pumilus]|nr:hypothetical protein [Pseudazoarcus pumilus]